MFQTSQEVEDNKKSSRLPSIYIKFEANFNYLEHHLKNFQRKNSKVQNRKKTFMGNEGIIHKDSILIKPILCT